MATTIGADGDGEASLCEAISIEQLDTVGPLQFDTTDFGFPGLCVFQTVSGSSLTWDPSSIGYDLLRRSAPDLIEFSVGERPAVARDDDLYVGLDDGVLAVALRSSDPGELDGLDPIDYQSQIAVLLLPTVLADGAGGDATASASSLPPIPEIAGIDWGRSQGAVSFEELNGRGRWRLTRSASTAAQRTRTATAYRPHRTSQATINRMGSPTALV